MKIPKIFDKIGKDLIKIGGKIFEEEITKAGERIVREVFI